MVKRTVQMGDNEPDQKSFDKPSEGEHLFQVVDVFDINSEIGEKLGLDIDTVSVKCEIAIGDEIGRTLLNRCSLSEKNKAFFATRLFLKAIGEQYHGSIDIDTDQWIGKQFFATVVHNKGFANIKEYNFDKVVKGQDSIPQPKEVSDVAWEE